MNCNSAGHSVRDRPGLIPNTEVKPHVAVILVRCVSPCEVTVLAPFHFSFFLALRLKFSGALRQSLYAN